MQPADADLIKVFEGSRSDQKGTDKQTVTVVEHMRFLKMALSKINSIIQGQNLSGLGMTLRQMS